MNTTFALNPDIGTTLTALAAFTDSARNSATRVGNENLDGTVRNQERHWLGNLGFSLALFVVVGLGALSSWTIGSLTILILQHPDVISDLELALSR